MFKDVSKGQVKMKVKKLNYENGLLETSDSGCSEMRIHFCIYKSL